MAPARAGTGGLDGFRGGPPPHGFPDRDTVGSPTGIAAMAKATAALKTAMELTAVSAIGDQRETRDHQDLPRQPVHLAVSGVLTACSPASRIRRAVASGAARTRRRERVISPSVRRSWPSPPQPVRLGTTVIAFAGPAPDLRELASRLTLAVMITIFCRAETAAVAFPS